MFSCNRCNYTTKTKANLIKHLRTKAICKSENDIDRNIQLQELTTKKETEFKCDKCRKSFSFTTSMYRHQKNCNTFVDDTARLRHDLKTLSTELQSLKTKAASENTKICTPIFEQFEERITQTEESIDEEESKPVLHQGGFLYIVWLREFVACNTPIYKIGRSKDITSRIKDYPKNSKLLYCVYTDDIVTKESKLIEILKQEGSGVKHQSVYGNEYFLGNYSVIKTYIEQLA